MQVLASTLKIFRVFLQRSFKKIIPSNLSGRHYKIRLKSSPEIQGFLGHLKRLLRNYENLGSQKFMSN